MDACAAFSIEDNGVEKLVIMQETNKAFLNKDLSEAIEKLHHNVFMQNEISVFDLVIMKPGSVLKTSSGKIKHSAY